LRLLRARMRPLSCSGARICDRPNAMHQVWFITGASSGFGATLAEASAFEGVAATTPIGG